MPRTATVATSNRTTTRSVSPRPPQLQVVDSPFSGDAYMGPKHVAYFRDLLTVRRDQAIESVLANEAVMQSQNDFPVDGDEADRAAALNQRENAVRDLAQRRAEVRELSAALHRLSVGEFGYCEETGEPIGIARLQANPVARYSVEAQAHMEHRERGMAPRSIFQ